MDQKTILVSGANGNLGRAVCHYFQMKNWRVSGVVRHKNDSDLSGNYFPIVADLLQPKSAQNAVLKTMDRFGNIDAAVLTAGGFAMGNIENTSAEEITRMIQLNFATAYNLVQPILKQMTQQKSGRIFLIGSGQGLDTKRGSSAVAYSLSKSLLFQLSNIINSAAKKAGVQSFVIVPSIIDTPQNRKDMPDADFSKWEKPDQIAEIIFNTANKTASNDSDGVLIVQKQLGLG